MRSVFLFFVVEDPFLTNLFQHLQSEIANLRNKFQAFEERCTEAENANKLSLVEAEKLQIKSLQLQETIERFLHFQKKHLFCSTAASNSSDIGRLESNLSNLESENQILRQQAIVTSSNDDLSEEMEM